MTDKKIEFVDINRFLSILQIFKNKFKCCKNKYI